MKALAAVLFLAVAALLWGCGQATGGDDQTSAEPSPPVVESESEPSDRVAYRRETTPFDAVDLSPEQQKRIDEISADYGAKFAAIGMADGADVNDRRDNLNREYSDALLAEMTSAQKDAYLEAVYRHIESFLDAHPEAKFEEVFIWGGAYAKKPEE